MRQKKRIETIDIAKGVGIFAVVWMHLANSVNESFVQTFLPYMLGMFYIVSAYFYKPGKGYLFNVKKRIKQVLLPFVLYSFIALLIYFIFENIIGNTITVVELLKAFGSVMLNIYAFTPINPSATTLDYSFSLTTIASINWFLQRLFLAELIFFAIADKALEDNKKMGLSIFGCLTVSVVLNLVLPFHLPFQFENAPAITALLLAGALAKKYSVVEYIENEYKTSKYWIIFAVTLVAYYLISLLDCKGLNLANGNYGPWLGWSIYPWFITNVLGTYLLLVVCNLISKVKPLSKLLQILGNHSLFILSFHVVIAKMISECIGVEDTANVTISAAPVVACVFLVIALCILIDVARLKIKANIANKKEIAHGN